MTTRSTTTSATTPPRPGPEVAQERRMAVANWLLSAAIDPDRAGQEWPHVGTVLLRCGALFTVVRMPGRLVDAAAGTSSPEGLSLHLRELVDGGGVWTDRCSRAVYFLVPFGAIGTWSVPGTECLDERYVVGVPWPGREPDRGDRRSYWLAEMAGPGVLCPPEAVADVAHRGTAALLRPPPAVPAADLERVREYVRQALDLTSGLPRARPDLVRVSEVAAGLRAHVGVLIEWMQHRLDQEPDGTEDVGREGDACRWLLRRIRSRLDHRPGGDGLAIATALEALALDARALVGLVEHHASAIAP
jgi:hypothetical protein